MILVNDQFIPRENVHIDIEDRGYQFGDGIYEVIRVYDGKIFRLDQHLLRLERSAKEIKLVLPMSIQEIKEKITKLIAINNLSTGIVYFQVTRGVAPREHSFPNNRVSVLTAYTTEKERPLDKIQNGIKVVTTEDIRWLRCDIKTINLLGNVLAKQFAIENQADETIQIRNNIVTEGSSSNFFIVKNGNLYTHPANNFILKGITRDVVEEIAQKLGIKFIEQEFSLNEVYKADEAFITSTTVEIMPVLQVNDTKISHQPGQITKTLQNEFSKLL
ncbi:D-amino-acid transaminase [Vulcanibacillus modesticaldus]|uniref:D-alanine aminotransferase n=1 Tax=Vulcanibacillus modesticaldus TaxID=337097 RepID=A0A1D2YV79_9BACI|nr:D-amino-acid transaminase [Vulcanibacillus modesticaldus]OEF99618.1 D-amino-acid transaminase [Vulcanibacillus modesticaldus]